MDTVINNVNSTLPSAAKSYIHVPRQNVNTCYVDLNDSNNAFNNIDCRIELCLQMFEAI